MEDLVLKTLDKIIDGCRSVKSDPEIHKDAKDLADCVIQDCHKARMEYMESK